MPYNILNNSIIATYKLTLFTLSSRNLGGR